MAGLANAGLLTQESFAALTGEIGSTRAALVAQGEDGGAVLVAMQDELQKAWEAQQKFGFTADEATQALIDEGVAAGIVGEEHKSSTDQMIDALNHLGDTLDAIAKKMGAELPEAAGKAAKGIQNQLGNLKFDVPVTVTTKYADQFSGSDLPPLPDVPGFAVGTSGYDFQPFGSESLVKVHNDEAIIPKGGGHLLANEIADAMGRGSGGGAVVQNFNMQGAILPDRRSLEVFARQLIPVWQQQRRFMGAR
jgi:hypothetical protein